MRAIVFRIELESFPGLLDGVVIVAGIVESTKRVGVVGERERIKTHGLVNLFPRLPMPRQRDKIRRVDAVLGGVARIQFNRALELSLCRDHFQSPSRTLPRPLCDSASPSFK